MVLAHDTEVSLQTAAALINSAQMPVDALATVADLDHFLAQWKYTGFRAGTMAELRSVRHLRTQLRAIWTAEEGAAVEQVNRILRNARAVPQLVKHDHWDWHLHAADPQAPLELRIAVESAMALVDVIRCGELGRLRLCAGDNCQAVVLDLTRNRSKRFCDTGNCANRTHVKAYRERRKSQVRA